MYKQSLLTELSTLSTVNGEWKVATLMVGVLDFKKEPIWTQLLLWLTINTFVVLVTLLRISEEAVGFWTLESGGHPTYKKLPQKNKQNISLSIPTE